VINKDENGLPAAIWYAVIKKGNYGPFISVEKRWVRKVRKDGKITETKYAGKSFNFPIDPEKATAMINAIRDLVLKAVSMSTEFTTAEAGLEGWEEEL